MSDDMDGGNKTKTNGEGRDNLDGGSLSPLNRYYEALADPRRRHTLYYLNEHRGEPITLDELAKQVAAMETDYSPDTLLEDECRPVRRELYHNHLPRVADYGIIDFDPRTEDVQFQQPSRRLLILLWVSHRIERMP